MAEATQEIQGELGCDVVSLELRDWAIWERDAGEGEIFEAAIQVSAMFQFLKDMAKYAAIIVLWWQMINMAAQGRNSVLVGYLLKWLEG